MAWQRFFRHKHPVFQRAVGRSFEAGDGFFVHGDVVMGEPSALLVRKFRRPVGAQHQVITP